MGPHRVLQRDFAVAVDPVAAAPPSPRIGVF